MRKLIVFLIKYFLFWLLYFWSAKALFLLLNFSRTAALTPSEILNIFRYGLVMDISTACYFLVLPGFLASLKVVLNYRFISHIIRGCTILFLIPASVLLVLDLKLYPHWGTRIGIQAFSYLKNSAALSASVSVGDVLLALAVTGIMVWSFVLLFRKMFPGEILPERNTKWYLFPVYLTMLAALIIPIRGGFNTSPLNMSSIAFSPKLFVNQAAANYIWNFGFSIEKRKVFTNPCEYMEPDQASKIFNEQKDSDVKEDSVRLIRLSDGKPPNVILVILESFSDKVIASLGGRAGVAVNLDSLCRSGVVFSSFYASGNRSDRGVSALLASYPSLLSSSVMQFSEKWEKLTFLPQFFNHNNYSSSFYYGGDINFYNLKSFVIKGGYGKIIEKGDFPADLRNMTKWGVPDGFLFERALKDLKKEIEPFFTTIYTISSHPPFDVPYSKIKGNSIENKFLNSVAYSDSCVGAFISAFRKLPQWQNTLVIITADHGALQPGPTEISNPDTYRIPLIWTGGVIMKPVKIDNIAGQTDLMPTLIRQLGWEPGNIRFGHDIFSSRQYAFYMLDSGWGYIIPEGKFYFNQELNNFMVIEKNSDVPVGFSFAKAYLQELHNDFLNR